MDMQHKPPTGPSHRHASGRPSPASLYAAQKKSAAQASRTVSPATSAQDNSDQGGSAQSSSAPGSSSPSSGTSGRTRPIPKPSVMARPRKAPQRYTRSSAEGGGPPVTQHLSPREARRHRGSGFSEYSAGGILIRGARQAYNPRSGRVHLSTVLVPIIGRPDRRGHILWSLPKGHIEDYETIGQTAIREIEEETGIEGRIIQPLGTIAYSFLSDGKRIDKTVHHFLLQFHSGQLGGEDAEIHRVRWISLVDLPQRLSYSDERRLSRQSLHLVAQWIRETYGTENPPVTPDDEPISKEMLEDSRSPHASAGKPTEKKGASSQASAKNPASTKNKKKLRRRRRRKRSRQNTNRQPRPESRQQSRSDSRPHKQHPSRQGGENSQP